MASRQRVRHYRENRSAERLRAHWEVERELADRLRNASPEERTELYGTVYDELFRLVPDHPQLQWGADPLGRAVHTARASALVQKFLPSGGVFLEIGAGDCALSLAIARHARRVYAVEVSAAIARVDDAPPSFQLLITDGREIPVPPGTVDVAYSNQLMEHLHPDDAAEQLRQIFAALRRGGRYICLTPHRLLGPGDISKYFADVPQGFHLREYDNRELRDLLAFTGFRSTEVLASFRSRTTTLPVAPFAAFETMFERLPIATRHRLKHWWLVRKLVSPGGGVIATKP